PGARLAHRCKGGTKFPLVCAFQNKESPSDGLTGLLHSAQFGFQFRLIRISEQEMTEAFGTNSWSSPSCLATRSTVVKVTPVTLPPGRLRLATKPVLTGSLPVTNTIGIVMLAAFAACTTETVFPTINATCRATRSAASPGSRSGRSSAKRYS